MGELCSRSVRGTNRWVGGETIKEMQSSTGCRINVSSQFNQNDPEREIALAGTRDAINRARQAIDEKVEASVTHPHLSLHLHLKTTNLTPPVLKVTQWATKPSPWRGRGHRRPRFLLLSTPATILGILRTTTTRRSATTSCCCIGCSRGPERPVCAIWRVPGVLCYVLCGDDATAGGARWCRRGSGTRNLIGFGLCVMFYGLHVFLPGRGRFLW